MKRESERERERASGRESERASVVDLDIAL
jgi:hypothetical protein